MRRTNWVFWGYGKKRSVVHMDPAQIVLGYGMGTLPFELPEPTSRLPAPQEYERRVGYGWRWNRSDGAAGHDWKPATSVADAIQQAHASLEHMRLDTRKIFERALEDVRTEP